MNLSLRVRTILLSAFAIGCAVGPSATPTADNSAQPGGHTPSATVAAATTSAEPSATLPVLREGPITPGAYVMLPGPEGWAECDMPHCAPEPPEARSMKIEITIPAGWNAWGSSTIIPAPPGSTESPDGAGLAIGWYPMGLHSDPCRPVPHSTPDILIGPTADDFVDAVVAHPSLDVSEPIAIELGGYSGWFLTLTAPSDISGCVDWRPWEHGIAAQGPDNIWKMWAVDVNSLRVLVLAGEFPGTSPEDSAELAAMVESIRFVVAP